MGTGNPGGGLLSPNGPEVWRLRPGKKQLEPTSSDEYISEHQPGETVTVRVVGLKQERAR
jgi:hypothetical protein